MGKKKEKEGVESAVGLRGSCKFTIGVPPERGEESWYIIKGGSRDSAEVRTMVKKNQGFSSSSSSSFAGGNEIYFDAAAETFFSSLSFRLPAT